MSTEPRDQPDGSPCIVELDPIMRFARNPWVGHGRPPGRAARECACCTLGKSKMEEEEKRRRKRALGIDYGHHIARWLRWATFAPFPIKAEIKYRMIKSILNSSP